MAKTKREDRTITIAQLKDLRYPHKFWTTLDGKRTLIYFIFDPPMQVVKLDGRHTYLWYRDERFDHSRIELTIPLPQRPSQPVLEVG